MSLSSVMSPCARSGRGFLARTIIFCLILLLGAVSVAVAIHPRVLPTDLKPEQWSLHNEGQTGGKMDADIDAPEAWALSLWSPEIIVAVIDSGIEVDHPDLSSKLWRNPGEFGGQLGFDDDGNGFADDIHGVHFIDGSRWDTDIGDRTGHGTSSAGVIAAETANQQNPLKGIAGICWSCRLMILKVGDAVFDSEATARAVEYATREGARVINLSAGASASDPRLQGAVEDAILEGIVVVAATGNSGADDKQFPSAYPDVLSVGSTNASDQRRTTSNYGMSLDLVAPGELIYTTDLGKTYTASFQGTSAAAPHVAGAAALLLSLDPTLSPEKVLKILVTTTDPGIKPNIDPATTAEPDSYYVGSGRLNLFNALSRVAFSDVRYDDWFNSYVALAFQKEVINGFSDRTFHPADPATRAEVLKMAYAAAGEQAAVQQPAQSGFADVHSSYWAFALIADAGQKGYIEGELCDFPSTAPCFFPDRAVNRAEALRMISALFKVDPCNLCIESVINVPKEQQTTFPDVEKSDWFYPYVHWMANAELRAERLPAGIKSPERLIRGYPDNHFRPGSLVNRAEMAKIVVNTMLYCRTGPDPHNCNTGTASLTPPSGKTLKAVGAVSIGAHYEQPIDPLNRNAPDPLDLPGGNEQIVTAPIPLMGETRDADGDTLFYFWSASGGSFTTSDPVNFSSVTWHPPTVSEDTLFTVDVVRGDRRGLVGRGSFRFLVPGTASNSPGSGTITGPNGTQTGSVTVSATASDADGLDRVYVSFTPSGPAVVLCGADGPSACSGTSGTYTRTNVNPATYGASAGTVTMSLFVEDAANDIRFVDSHAFSYSPPPAGPTYRLTVRKLGDGSGTISGSGLVCGPECTTTSFDLPRGTAVTLTGSAAAGSVFVGFAGNSCYGVDPCTVTLNRDVTVKASFGLPDTFALLYTTPANGETGVVSWTQATAYFNRDFVAGPSYANLVFRETGGTPVPFTPVVRSTDRRLVLIPSSNLVAGRSYVVEIPAGAVSDTQGNALGAPHSFTFTAAVAGAPKLYITAYPKTIMEGTETKVSLWFETPTAHERTITLTSTPAGELSHPSEVIVPAGEVLVELQVDSRFNHGSTSPVTVTLSASEAAAGQKSLPIVVANDTATTGSSFKFLAAGLVADDDHDGILETGEDGEIIFEVANFGSSTVSNGYLEFSVLNTRDLRILGGDGALYCHLPALAPGKSASCTKSVRAFEELPTGDYFIEVKGTSSANGFLDQARIHVVNNFLPDLILNAGTIPTSALQPGLTVPITYTARNSADGFASGLPLFEVTIEIEGKEHLLYHTYTDARGYDNNSQDFRLSITVPSVPGVHPIRGRINPPGAGRLTESDYTNNDAIVRYLTVAAPNQAPVLAPVPSPIAASVGKALAFTISASDPNSDPITYRLGSGAPAGATLNSTSGVFAWTPSCSQGPASYTFSVVAADDKGLEDTETVTIQVGLEADLVLGQIQSSETALPGETVGYTIHVENQGPSCITGATVSDTFPGSLGEVRWTCTATPGGSCAASGNGAISDSSLALPAGGSATYVVSAILSAFAQGVVTNTATVTPPASVTDPDGTDNSFTVSITLRGMDFGDAPESGSTWRFPTLLAGDGARHGVDPGLRLGASIDAEGDGQPSPGANGDDAAGARDEDGVSLPSPLVPCQTGRVQVTASAPGLLSVWIDFNTDSDWDDADEWVIAQQSLAAGVTEVSVSVPCGATPGGTAVGRFRFSSEGGLAPYGLARDGEVEDHPLPIAQVFHRLTVVRTGSGTVTASPGGIDCGADCVEDYLAGSVITLAAHPASGSVFSGWSGAGCSGSGFCIVTLDAAGQVGAAFGPFIAPPSVTTSPAAGFGPTGATLNATVNPNGSSTTVDFEYGTTASYGSTVTQGNIGSGTVSLSVSRAISGLLCDTEYHFRARATNTGGTSFGSNQTFRTASCSAVYPDTTGVFRPSNGALYLKNQNTSGFADVLLTYGLPGDYPVAGDWNGDGVDTIGIYRNGTFYLRNSNTNGFADIVVTFGTTGDQPVVGDWNGDGIDTIGIFRNGTFYLRNSNTVGTADLTFTLGSAGDVGIAGDWNGDGITTAGVFRPSNGALYLKNSNSTGFAEIVLTYGLPGDKPVTGDWNGDGVDTIGVYRGGTFYLRNSNTNGFADLVFSLGVNGDMPIAGDWNGLP